MVPKTIPFMLLSSRWLGIMNNTSVKAIEGMVFGTSVLKYWLLGPFGYYVLYTMPYYRMLYHTIYHTILSGSLFGTWTLWFSFVMIHVQPLPIKKLFGPYIPTIYLGSSYNTPHNPKGPSTQIQGIYPKR